MNGTFVFFIAAIFFIGCENPEKSKNKKKRILVPIGSIVPIVPIVSNGSLASNDVGVGPIISTSQNLCIPKGEDALCLSPEKNLDSADGSKALLTANVSRVHTVAASSEEICMLSQAGIKCRNKDSDVHTDKGVAAPTTLVAGLHHFCARDEKYNAFCWGDNQWKQTGADSNKTVTEPHLLNDLKGKVSRIRTGYSHTCIVDTESHVWCFGDNRQGQLGDGGVETRSKAVKVEGLPLIEDLALGLSHTCALSSEAIPRVFCWGSNHLSQLGIAGSENSYKPVELVFFGRVSKIAAGASHTCLLDDEENVWCWGSNQFGQFKEGGKVVPKPLQIVGLASIKLMVLSHYFSLFIGKDGSPQFLGENYGISDDIKKELAKLIFIF